MSSYYERNREAIVEKRRVWRAANKEREKEQTKKYREKHRDILRIRSAIQIAKRPDRNKEYHAENKEAVNARKRARYRENINTKMAKVLRARLGYGIKNGSPVRDLGCSILELVSYLERRFLPGMTWDNWSIDGWHIDHIVPLANFDLSDRAQMLRAVHYTNLQPLWALDNIKKGRRA